MNQAHVHLMITHLPIFGSILGALVLTYGLWTKSHQTKVAAYFLLIISAIGSGIAYLTGEARTFAVVTLFVSLISFGLVAQTGYLGGKIRHT
ncbi:MAG: hypothetical protein SF052_27255 [Bacteroidia bacterium]|nr:hypothetical protein [Bacteroidia bacterium]